jgi:hypothetical protein
MGDFHYIDPRGRRSGPYTESELKLLASRGLLEPDGTIELENVSGGWPVGEVPWLRADATPYPPPPPKEFTSPALSPEEVMARPFSVAPVPEPAPACSRTLFILLALLPAFVGVFGIHSLIAGYTTRGIVALVLSIATFSGMCCIIAPPCVCVSVPIWIVLFVMAVIDAITIKVDARGQPFR